MRQKAYSFIFVCAIAAAMSLGCSGGHVSDPVAPGNSPQSISTIQAVTGQAQDNRYLIGFYNIAYDPETNSAEVIPVRDVAKHFNVLKFLETAPCAGCVQVMGVTPLPDGTKDFFTVISHPFSNPTFTGFDVRGIALFKGSHTFTISGLTAPDRAKGDGQLVNADGYSALYNSTTIPNAPYEGYVKGKFASPTTPNADINGFKQHKSYMGGNNPRNIFIAGDGVGSDYIIDMPNGAFIFGYAIDASWVPPTVTPVTDPAADFPPDANCFEPYQIEFGGFGQGFTENGGAFYLIATIYDHGGSSTYSPPIVECPDLWDGQFAMNLNWDGGTYAEWGLGVSNQKLAPEGDYKILVTCEANENAVSPPHLNLTTYQIFDVHVRPEQGLALTWGGDGSDTGYGIGVDIFENIYVAGYFDDSPGGIDFDPGPGEDNRQTNGFTDCFLVKYDPEGNLLWTRTFGGPGYDIPYDLYVHEFGDCYMVGLFSNSVQFDPAGGAALKTSSGGDDAFIVKYDWAGKFQWVATWGGTGIDVANGVSEYSGNPVVVGSFESVVDFNSSVNIDNRTSQGLSDAYMTTYDYDGNYLKTYTWGGTDLDSAVAVASSGTAYIITGWWQGTMNINPYPSIPTLVTSQGFMDGYVMVVDASTDFLLNFKLMQSVGPVIPTDMVQYGSDLYISGAFFGMTDFNVGGTADIATSNGNGDAFLMKNDTSGNHVWTKTWGGTENEAVFAVDTNYQGDVYAGGSFGGTVDFDPGAGTDLISTNGFNDAFVTKLQSDGSYLWTNGFGSPASDDHVYKIFAFFNGSVYATGPFTGTVDFDPSGSNDDHVAQGNTDCYLLKYESDGGW